MTGSVCCPAGGAACSRGHLLEAPPTLLTQVGVSADDQLSFSVLGQFEVERPDALLLELCLLLVEEFTPGRRQLLKHLKHPFMLQQEKKKPTFWSRRHLSPGPPSPRVWAARQTPHPHVPLEKKPHQV